MIPEITSLTGMDIPIIFAVIGAIFLYFGVLIADTRVERYDKVTNYIFGMFFSAVFVFIPLLTAYYVRDWYVMHPFWLLVIQIIILICLSLNLHVNLHFKKHGLFGEFKKRFKEEIQKIRKSDTLKGKLIKEQTKKRKGFSDELSMDIFKAGIFFESNVILLIFSFLTLLSTFHSFESGNILVFGISMVFSIFNLTLIAFAFGFKGAYYPPAKIFLDDGNTISCRIIKFSDMIYCIKDKKKFFINKDKIRYIEESLLKEDFSVKDKKNKKLII